MNNVAPELSAAQAADLAQQLRLAQEGSSRLAQRCLDLEQEMLTCQAALAKHSHSGEAGALLLPQLFYDTGSGFSPRECLTMTEEVYNELEHEVSMVFVLPTDARALRLDPGELPCCITDLDISDERLVWHPVGGLRLQEDQVLFLEPDPILILDGMPLFPAGLKFAVNYHYYPLGSELQEQPGKSLLGALSALRQETEAARQETDTVRRQLDTVQRALDDVRQQLSTAQESQSQYETALENVLQSSSWKLTAPLRALLGLFHH